MLNIAIVAIAKKRLEFAAVKIKIIVIASIFSVVLLFLVIYFFQKYLIFFPDKLPNDYVFNFKNLAEEKFVTYSENKKIHGLLFKVKYPKSRIIYFHGNGGSLDSWGEVADTLSERLRSEVLILDYPGYGKSDGQLASNQKELLESATAAYNEFIKISDSKLPLVIYGRSLGTGVASYLAINSNAELLVLETPYSSIRAMAKKRFPILPSFLLRYDFDNEKNLKDIKIPVVIFHGTADSVVPFEQGHSLASVMNSKSKFVTISGGEHNNLSDFPDYWQALEFAFSNLNLIK